MYALSNEHCLLFIALSPCRMVLLWMYLTTWTSALIFYLWPISSAHVPGKSFSVNSSLTGMTLNSVQWGEQVMWGEHYIHTYTHTHTHTCAHMQFFHTSTQRTHNTQAHTHTHAHTHIHTHAGTHTRMYTHKHTHTHTCRHTHTHVHTH